MPVSVPSRRALRLASLALLAGCATAEVTDDYDAAPAGDDVAVAPDAATAVDGSPDDSASAVDVTAPLDAPRADASVVPDAVDVVTPRDVVAPTDVVIAPDVITAIDVVLARDVVAIDVVTPRDIVAPPDIVIPTDIVAPPDIVIPTDDGRCATGAMRACYTGPGATRSVGACRDGVETCRSAVWGACSGQALPAVAETCGDMADNDCNGRVDDGCPTPVAAPQVSALAIGNVHACVVDESQRTSCWGGNPFGQIGSLAATGVSVPTRVASLDGVQHAAHENFHCVRRADGTVACTGKNDYGTLGDGTTTQRNGPVAVTGLRGATWIAAGYNHACAVVDGAVRCWGRNESRQLGAATTATCMSSACSTAPVAVPGVTGAVQVVAGASHTCALLRDGTVRCWGDNASGQIGIGTMGSPDLDVTAVPGLSGVVQLAAGLQSTCAVISDGTVRCWGGNTYGLFLDTGAARTAPTQVPGLAGVAQLALAAYHACARLTSGALRCWGYNNFGQIGDGTTMSPRPLVTPTGLPAVSDVAVGYWRTCARTAARTVWCWGWNLSGGVGNGTTSGNVTTPVQIIP